MHDILDVIKNIQSLYENNSSLAVLKDFERVLDELDLYVYENWIDGEIAYGPKVDRHWITAGFMWPENKMPDPTGGKRLVENGCKLKYQKSQLILPRPIKNPDDVRPGTKKGKLDEHPIWIVEIRMPKEVAFDMYRGYMNKMKSENKSSNTSKQESQIPPPAAAPTGAPPMSPAGTGAPVGGSPAGTGMPAPVPGV
jgi:hypothetical protein